MHQSWFDPRARDQRQVRDAPHGLRLARKQCRYVQHDFFFNLGKLAPPVHHAAGKGRTARATQQQLDDRKDQLIVEFHNQRVGRKRHNVAERWNVRDMVFDRQLIDGFELHFNGGSEISVESSRKMKGECFVQGAQRARIFIRKPSCRTEIARMHNPLFGWCLGSSGLLRQCRHCFQFVLARRAQGILLLLASWARSSAGGVRDVPSASPWSPGVFVKHAKALLQPLWRFPSS